MLLAQRLQSAGDYQAALDWYWILYPYDVEPPVSIFDRLNTETLFRPDLTFPPQWTALLDPFALVANRPMPVHPVHPAVDHPVPSGLRRCRVHPGDRRVDR